MAEYPFVSEVCVIYGEYDLLAKIRVENLDQLDSVVQKIRMIPSITFTSTMIVGREFKDQGKRVSPHMP